MIGFGRSSGLRGGLGLTLHDVRVPAIGCRACAVREPPRPRCRRLLRLCAIGCRIPGRRCAGCQGCQAAQAGGDCEAEGAYARSERIQSSCWRRHRPVWLTEPSPSRCCQARSTACRALRCLSRFSVPGLAASWTWSDRSAPTPLEAGVGAINWRRPCRSGVAPISCSAIACADPAC